MDFAKERQLTDVVLFAYWKVGTSNKLLPAVLSTGCGNRSPLPQFPHKWNNYSAVVKAWKPSEEKQHYLENYFNTKMKLSRGTPCPVSHAENTSAFKYPAPAREEKKKIYIYGWCKGTTVSGSARRHFLSKSFSQRGETVCWLAASQIWKPQEASWLFFFIIHFCGPLNLHDDSEQRMVCFFPWTPLKLKLRPTPFSHLEANHLVLPYKSDFPKMIQVKECNFGTILHILLMSFYSRNNLFWPSPSASVSAFPAANGTSLLGFVPLQFN